MGKPVPLLPLQFELDSLRSDKNNSTHLKISSANPDSKPTSPEYIDQHIKEEKERAKEGLDLDTSGGRHADHIAALADKGVRMDRVSLHELGHVLQHASGKKLTKLEREFIYKKWKQQEENEKSLFKLKTGRQDAIPSDLVKGLTHSENGFYQLDDNFDQPYAGKMYRVKGGTTWKTMKDDPNRDPDEIDDGFQSKVAKTADDFWDESEGLDSEAYEVITVGMETLLFGGSEISQHGEYRDFVLGILFGF